LAFERWGARRRNLVNLKSSGRGVQELHGTVSEDVSDMYPICLRYVSDIYSA
jgi:hypothetical protein